MFPRAVRAVRAGAGILSRAQSSVANSLAGKDWTELTATAVADALLGHQKFPMSKDKVDTINRLLRTGVPEVTLSVMGKAAKVGDIAAIITASNRNTVLSDILNTCINPVSPQSSPSGVTAVIASASAPSAVRQPAAGPARGGSSSNLQ